MEKLENIFNTLELHSLKWSHYFEIYEKYLSKFIGKKPVVLEIGTKCGGGIEMLHKYFGGGKYYAFDIWEEIAYIDFAKKGIDCEIILGDQSDKECLKNFVEKYKDIKFDIIIDDGSHVPTDQYLTVSSLFPMLKNDGVYVIEDTLTSYQSTTKIKGGIFSKTNIHQKLNIFSSVLNYIFLDDMDKKTIKTKFPDDFNLIGLNSLHVHKSMIVLIKEKFISTKQVYSDGKDFPFPKDPKIYHKGKIINMSEK